MTTVSTLSVKFLEGGKAGKGFLPFSGEQAAFASYSSPGNPRDIGEWSVGCCGRERNIRIIEMIEMYEYKNAGNN